MFYNFRENKLPNNVVRLSYGEHIEQFINLDMINYIKIEKNYLKPDNKSIKMKIDVKDFEIVVHTIDSIDSIDNFLKSFPEDVQYIRFVDDLGELYIINCNCIHACGTFQGKNSDTIIDYVIIIENSTKKYIKKTRNV